MDKGVNKVRKAIAQRNKVRSLKTKETSSRQILPVFPQEEEKHGYFPSFIDSPLEVKGKPKWTSKLVIKGVLSVSLFFGVAILMQTNSSLLIKPKNWTSHMLTEEFPFARVNQWYQSAFGSPLGFTPKMEHVTSDIDPLTTPVMGNVTESFIVNGTGIMISPEVASNVSAWNEGIVIFAGNDRETDKTVIIQHPDQSKSTYGFLSSIDVYLYQFVAEHQRVGSFNPVESSEPVYFSIVKDKEYIDPVKVIPVEDLP